MSVVAIVSCAPKDPVPPISKHQVQPDCMAGFCGSDPDPSAMGVYIASSISDTSCTSDALQDTDEDGLSDICEQNIADAFAPWLHYSSNETSWGGEPTYAAMPLRRAGTLLVRVIYMLSYYDDAGSPGADCLWLPVNWCDGHWGDSEAIIEEVRYDPSTEHWILNDAAYSRHTYYDIYSGSSRNGYNQYTVTADSSGYIISVNLTSMDSIIDNTAPISSSYPTYLSYNHGGKLGGPPDVWVAVDKHANYAKNTDCASTDDCEDDEWTQPWLYDDYNGNRNVGSHWARRIDTIPAYNPAVSGGGYKECYWTCGTFGGWSGISTPVAPGYGYWLYEWGFFDEL